MYSEKATRNPPKSSVIENALAMLLESVQEQNPVVATLNDQRNNDSFQSEIERLDCLADDRILAAESVLLAARRSAAALLRRRNALVPLHRLPSEVLALILLESLDFENGFDQMALQSLAQVAHRWWEIIKSQPRFWTCVLWPAAGDNMASNIPKAKTLPIQLFNRQDWHSQPTDFLQRNVKSLLQTHADRWFKISIVSDWTMAYIPPLFTEVLERSAFSRLEVLKMMGVQGVFHVEICRLERLREAWLSFIPCSGHGPDPTNPAPLLTYLNLTLSPYQSYSLSCLVSFLRHCTNLQELDILDLSDWEDDTQRQRQSSFISLPALRSLSIKHTSDREAGPEIQILGLIRCPNLANFKMHYYRDPDSDTDSDSDTEGIDVAGVFRVLRDASQFEPDALPMSSAVRNIGESVYFNVVLETDGVQIWARKRGAPESRPVDFILQVDHINMEDFSRDILPYLTSFDIPIELTSLDQLEQAGWEDIVDRFQNVTVLEFRGTLDSAMELIEELSQPVSSLPPGRPRAPRLETLKLHDKFGYVSWTADIHKMPPLIAEMLAKRRGLFKSAGMVWPSEFRVRTNFYIFNEDEGVWTQLEEERHHSQME